MTYQGRSLDDLPLAAYSTGAVPDEQEEPLDTQHQLTQQEAIAQALGVAPPAPEPQAAAEQPAAKRSRGLPKLRVPKLGRPKLPGLGGPDAAERPRMTPAPAPARMAAPPQFSPATQVGTAPQLTTAPQFTAAPQPGAPTMAAAGTAAAAGTIAAPRTGPLGALDMDALGRLLRDPRAAVRDPRVLLGGVLVLGLVLLAASLVFGGGGAGGVGDDATASEPPVVATPGPPTGTATFEIETKTTPVTVTLAGRTGGGPAVGDRIDATWADTVGNALAISGRAASGTRTTSAELVLTLTAIIDGAPVTFTSQDGECTVGMARLPKLVQGSFVCDELESSDGEVVIHVSGTYRT